MQRDIACCHGMCRALAVLCFAALLVLNAPSHAAERDSVHSYYLDEPVFGAQAYVIEAGREHSRTVLLVHGLGPNAARIWQPLIPQLASRYHVVAVDLPGFGRSSKGNHLYSPANYARFLDFVIERTANRPYVLIGHSMGANVALHYSISHPQRFERLVLVDAGGVLHRFAYSQYLTHFGIERIPEFYPQQGQELREFATRMLESLSLNSQWMSQAESLILENPSLRETLLRAEPNTIAGYAMAMADYSGQLKTLAQPTLILWGEQDAVTPLRTARVLARRLPRAAWVALPRAGHSPMSDQPKAFNAWVRRFADAGPAELDALLQAHRYAPPAAADTPVSSYRCRGEKGDTLQGHYDEILIENCDNVTLKDFTARHITIRHSSVTMENGWLRSDQTALKVQDARVQITACEIKGAIGIELDNAELDIAGSELHGGEYVIHQARATRPSRILFSVSHLSSRYIDKPVHGPMHFPPDEGI